MAVQPGKISPLGCHRRLPTSRWGEMARRSYTAPGFPVYENYPQATGPWYAFTESGGTSWHAYNSQTPCAQGYCNGPVMTAYDPLHHLIYSANFLGGIWQLPLPPPQTTTDCAAYQYPNVALYGYRDHNRYEYSNALPHHYCNCTRGGRLISAKRTPCAGKPDN